MRKTIEKIGTVSITVLLCLVVLVIVWFTTNKLYQLFTFNNGTEKQVETHTHYAQGFCLDNDGDSGDYIERLEYLTNLLPKSCKFISAKQGILGCLGDDYYSFMCEIEDIINR